MCKHTQLFSAHCCCYSVFLSLSLLSKDNRVLVVCFVCMPEDQRPKPIDGELQSEQIKRE